MYRKILFIFLLSVGLSLFYLREIINFPLFIGYQNQILIFVSNYFFLSLFVFILAYIIIIIFSIPGSLFMSLLGGYLYSTYLGGIINLLSATIGATLFFVFSNFLISRSFQLEKFSYYTKIKEGFAKNSFWYLLFFRLVPIFPFFIINIIAATLHIPIRTFIAASLIGMLPGSLIFAYVGNNLNIEIVNNDNFELSTLISSKIIVVFVLLGITSLIPILFKKWKYD
jgi:uncharacterized membrane protein YdjX (TVP38/TMEM64 family)